MGFELVISIQEGDLITIAIIDFSIKTSINTLKKQTQCSELLGKA